MTTCVTSAHSHAPTHSGTASQGAGNRRRADSFTSSQIEQAGSTLPSVTIVVQFCFNSRIQSNAYNHGEHTSLEAPKSLETAREKNIFNAQSGFLFVAVVYLASFKEEDEKIKNLTTSIIGMQRMNRRNTTRSSEVHHFFRLHSAFTSALIQHFTQHSFRGNMQGLPHQLNLHIRKM